MKAEGNARLASVNKETQELSKNEGMSLGSPILDSLLAPRYDWSAKTAEQRQVLRLRLDNYIGNINRIFEIGQHKNMKLKGDTAGLDALRTSAKAYLASLDKFEGKTSPAPAQPKPSQPEPDRDFRRR